MFELTTCPMCAAVKCSCPKHLHACADCETYTPVSSLTEKPDGRKVCPTCQGRIRRHTEAKRQMNLFGQDSLFGLKD